MTRSHPIRCAVVALSTRPQRAPWLPRPVRRALDGYRLRVALTEPQQPAPQWRHA